MARRKSRTGIGGPARVRGTAGRPPRSSRSEDSEHWPRSLRRPDYVLAAEVDLLMPPRYAEGRPHAFAICREAESLGRLVAVQSATGRLVDDAGDLADE